MNGTNRITLSWFAGRGVILALEQFTERPVVGFPDSLVLETARKAGHLPLGTFDRDLAKLDVAERLQ